MKKSVKRSSSRVKNNFEDEKKLFAFLATFLSIVGFIIALIAKRKDKYVMYYAKHSLVIFVILIIAGALGRFFLIFPIAGDIINVALIVFSVALWLISWMYALSGKQKEIPVITDWANKIDL
jgi:uncharacterized membrane protein